MGNKAPTAVRQEKGQGQRPGRRRHEPITQHQSNQPKATQRRCRHEPSTQHQVLIDHQILNEGMDGALMADKVSNSRNKKCCQNPT
jgi:hypothetical protein